MIVFEGRDAAGKGGTIKRFMEHLNPRGARVVALRKPPSDERGQWYFQRYVEHLPTAGEIVLFDRSWYNRAGVERVMGFCTDDEYHEFMRQAPMFERMLVTPASRLVKFWFSVTRRAAQPIRGAPDRPGPAVEAVPDRPRLPGPWEDYTTAKERCSSTPTPSTRRGLVKTDGKKRARINAMRAFLNQFDYEGKDPTWSTRLIRWS